MSSLGLNLVEQAIIFAVNAHAGTKRKGCSVPYIVHPLETAAIAAGITDEPEVIAAAALHDTLEDTSVTFEELKEAFGERVALLVCSDSENKRVGLPAADTWHMRKTETLTLALSASHQEQIVILADKLSNMRSIYRDSLKIGDDIWLRFNQKDKNQHKWYYTSFLTALTKVKDEPAFEEYAELIKRVFG